MLTKRQKQVLDFIKKYKDKKDYAPSLEEIKKHLKLSSVSTIHHHIKALEDLGYLRREENQPRGIDVYKKERMVSISLLGTIAAGQPILAVEEKETIAIPKSSLPKSGNFYALKVAGNSMIDENINNGDIVVIRSQPTANDGEKVIALIVDSNEVTLKKIFRMKDKIRLQPANPKISSIYIDANNLKIQGKVITVIKTLEKIRDRPNLKTSLFVKKSKALQDTLFNLKAPPRFPSTRFQGNKLKLVSKIWNCLKDLRFDSAIDLFGGTSAVSYMFKTKGKQVFYNDYLRFNYLIGLAVVENCKVKLNDDDIDFILSVHSNIDYPDFIQKTFKDIYYTDKENKWLDIVSTNIRQINNKYKQALAYFALFQSCLVKRPYNLFHRKNLYVRFADVKRSFGNKTTWDKPFENHFIKFVDEVNGAVFDNGKKNKAFCSDAFDLNAKADLVYIDTPYISTKGVGVDYLDFYHFLEGLTFYNKWYNFIDYSSKHRKFKNEKKSLWSDKNKILQAFEKLFDRYKNSILVLSYRSDGIPSLEQLIELMRKYKKNVKETFRSNYKYALSKNGNSKEILVVGA